MSQRDIIKLIEQVGADTVEAADAEDFRVGLFDTGLLPRADRLHDELVGQQHVSLRRIHVHLCHDRADGVVVAVRLHLREVLLRVRGPHVDGLQERHQPEMDRAVFVLEGHGFPDPGEFRSRRVEFILFEEVGEVAHVGRGVVVPADDEHRLAAGGQVGEEPVVQFLRLPGDLRFVIDVAAEQNGIRPFPLHRFEDLVQDVPLVRQQGNVMDLFSDVQVREVE